MSEIWTPVSRTSETWTPVGQAPPAPPPPPDPTVDPPVNTGLPQITGTVDVGQTITGSTGTWTGSPSFTRLWFLNGVATGVTAASYAIPADAFGASIYERVVATNAGGSVVASSVTVNTPSAPVEPAYTPSLDFSDSRNSQYLMVLWL